MMAQLKILSVFYRLNYCNTKGKFAQYALTTGFDKTNLKALS